MHFCSSGMKEGEIAEPDGESESRMDWNDEVMTEDNKSEKDCYEDKSIGATHHGRGGGGNGGVGEK